MTSMVVDYRHDVGQHKHEEQKTGKDRNQTNTGGNVRHVKPPLNQTNERLTTRGIRGTRTAIPQKGRTAVPINSLRRATTLTNHYIIQPKTNKDPLEHKHVSFPVPPASAPQNGVQLHLPSGAFSPGAPPLFVKIPRPA